MATSSVSRAAVPLIALLASSLGAAEAQGAPESFDLISPTNGAWCTATCKFSWQGSSSAASYDLYIDGVIKKAMIVPASPLGYTLATGEATTDGWHTWSVVAKDSTGGTQQSTSTFSVRVDASPPTAPAQLSPAANAWVGSYSPAFSWTGSSDVGSGLVGYEILINGVPLGTGIAASATSATVDLPVVTTLDTSFATTCPGSWQWTSGTWYCGYASGAWHLSLGNGDSPPYGTATMAGLMDLSNAGHAELRIYHKWLNQSSTLEINTSTDGGTNWQRVVKLPVNATGNNAQQSTFALDDTTGTTTAKLQLGGKVSSGEGWYVDWLSVRTVLGGPYAWKIVAVDAAGNRAGSEIRQLQYDLPPLPFTLVSPPDGTWVTSSTPTFTWNATSDTGSGLAKYQIWIDGKLAVDNIPPDATTATATSVIADGVHTWQVYALDAAGAIRRSRQILSLGVDTTPPQSFGIVGDIPGSVGEWGLACENTYTIPTPCLSWTSSTDTGSGIDYYQLIIDGTIARDRIALTGGCLSNTPSATPSSPLAEGVHAYTVTAFDKVGNHVSSGSCRLVVDFNPPSGFDLVSPVDNGVTIPVVNTLTPTFTWEPSISTGSGVDHYELYVTDPAQGGNLVCVECSIPSSSTSVTITKSVTPGIHGWNVRAVDHVGGFKWGNAGQAGIARFNARCTDGCASAPETAPEPGPEAGPEPAPEPNRDAGIDAPMDSGSDLHASTVTSTATATSTQTATRTATTTTTSTGTSTSIVPEPQPDGAPLASVDAVVSDAPVARDVLQLDAGGGFDTLVATVGADGSIITGFHDAGSTLADSSAAGPVDAVVAKPDGGRTNTIDSAGHDGGSNSKVVSSGCGCTLGGAGTQPDWGWPLVLAGLVALWRVSRRRNGR
jgi:MYXO-CTERM domain-containing protein